MKKIYVKDLLLTQPYIGRPSQLPKMIDSILKNKYRKGDKIQLIKTKKGIYLYDGNCWSVALYLSGREGGRNWLHPKEYNIYKLGIKEQIIIMKIKGKKSKYFWDGNGLLLKGLKGFNIYKGEKARNRNKKRIYRKKTLKKLPDLAKKYLIS